MGNRERIIIVRSNCLSVGKEKEAGVDRMRAFADEWVAKGNNIVDALGSCRNHDGTKGGNAEPFLMHTVAEDIGVDDELAEDRRVVKEEKGGQATFPGRTDRVIALWCSEFCHWNLCHRRPRRIPDSPACAPVCRAIQDPLYFRRRFPEWAENQTTR